MDGVDKVDAEDQFFLAFSAFSREHFRLKGHRNVSMASEVCNLWPDLLPMAYIHRLRRAQSSILRRQGLKSKALR